MADKIDTNLQKFINDWIPLFDEVYTQKQIKVPDRPFKATIAFINKAILEVRNTTKDKLKGPPLFGYFYRHVYLWYKDHYGDALNRSTEDDYLTTYIIIRKLPYGLKIPKTLREDHTDNTAKWLVFPNEIMEYEVIWEWIINKPNMMSFKDEEMNKLEKIIRKRVNLLRNSYTNSITTNLYNKSIERMQTDIFTHLRNFSSEMVLNFNKGLSNALWELHLAMEKVLKIYLLQNKIAYNKVHDLDYLFKLTSLKNKRIDRFITNFPQWKDAIKYRYGELVEINMNKVNKYYDGALETINYLIEMFDRDLKMRNGKFLYKNIYKED